MWIMLHLVINNHIMHCTQAWTHVDYGIVLTGLWDSKVYKSSLFEIFCSLCHVKPSPNFNNKLSQAPVTYILIGYNYI